MMEIDVIADIILFHPYDGDHWGFDCLGIDADRFYLEYAISRLAAFRNVWWSMANEWSFVGCKCTNGGDGNSCSENYWD